MSFGKRWLSEWLLDPATTYLNHGTVGATPKRVLAAQREIIDAIERQPSRFLLRELTQIGVGVPGGDLPRLRRAANEVARWLGARGEDVVFVDNATTAVNAVVRSFPLQAGDEILVSDLGYGGVTRAAIYAAREKGGTVRTVTMPYPFTTAGLTEAWATAVGPATRLAIVDHVSAESALVFPLAAIAGRLAAQDVAVLADGAHAPGALALDIPALGVDWYVGNLHKWAWTPRSSGILWANRDRQIGLHPAVISWGLDEGFTAEFDLPGTRDPSPHLSAPAAIALFDEWGTDAVRAYNHTLAWEGAKHLAERWHTPFETAESLIGTMATVPLPEAAGRTREDALRLRAALLSDDHIEVQMHAYRERLHVRISAQIYNDLDDVDRLASAIGRRVPAQ